MLCAELIVWQMFTFSWRAKQTLVGAPIMPQTHRTLQKIFVSNILLMSKKQAAQWVSNNNVLSILRRGRTTTVVRYHRSCQNKLFFPHWLAVSIYTMITAVLLGLLFFADVCWIKRRRLEVNTTPSYALLKREQKKKFRVSYMCRMFARVSLLCALCYCLYQLTCGR